MEWLQETVTDHWPFAAVACCLWVVGHFMETSVFTAKRAAESPLFFWARASMELHPMVAGAFIGTLWLDPLGEGWEPMSSIWYFAFAGVVSMFVWKLLSVVLGRFGVDTSKVKLPGEDGPPEADA